MLQTIECLFERETGDKVTIPARCVEVPTHGACPTQSFADTLMPRIVHVPAANGVRPTDTATPTASVVAATASAAAASNAIRRLAAGKWPCSSSGATEEAEAVRLADPDHRVSCGARRRNRRRLCVSCGARRKNL